MSNSNNLGREIKRLRKELSEIDAKDRSFHFIVGDSNETADAKLERMKAEGSVQAGDNCQLVQVPWAIKQLKGSAQIPEGNSADPYAEPELPPPPQTTKWSEQRDREEKWKAHVKKIERDGQRYDSDKPKDTTWR